MPSWELFERQPQEYRDERDPAFGDRPGLGGAGRSLRLGSLRRLGAAQKIGMDSFGTSAPLLEVQKKFGFTVDHVRRAGQTADREGVKIMSHLVESAAYKALLEHRRQLGHAYTCGSSSPRILVASRRFSLELGDLLFDYSKNRITRPHPGPAVALAKQQRRRSVHRAHVPRRQDQHHRRPRGAPRRAAQPLEPADSGRRRGRDAQGQRRARQDAASSRDAVQSGAWRGHTGKPITGHRQHRHRRLGPRADDGDRSPAPLLEAGARTSTSFRTSTPPISAKP